MVLGAVTGLGIKIGLDLGNEAIGHAGRFEPECVVTDSKDRRSAGQASWRQRPVVCPLGDFLREGVGPRITWKKWFGRLTCAPRPPHS